MRFISMAVMAAVMGVGVADAGTVSTASPDYSASSVQLVHNLTHGKITVEKTFAGPESNLTGVVGKTPNGAKGIVWVVDGKYLVEGYLVGADGKNIALQYAQKEGLVPSQKSLFTKAMQDKASFVIGTKGPEEVVFMDPDCIFCHKAYDDLYPLVQQGKLRLKIDLVGFLKPDSAAKATTILMSSNPAAEMHYNEEHFNDAEEEGGVVPAAHLNPSIEKEVSDSTHLLSESGGVATPTFLLCKNGKQEVLKGLPYSFQPQSFINGLTSVGADGSCSK